MTSLWHNQLIQCRTAWMNEFPQSSESHVALNVTLALLHQQWGEWVPELWTLHTENGLGCCNDTRVNRVERPVTRRLSGCQPASLLRANPNQSYSIIPCSWALKVTTHLMNDDVTISHRLFREIAGSNYPEFKRSIQYWGLFDWRFGRGAIMPHGFASA